MKAKVILAVIALTVPAWALEKSPTASAAPPEFKVLSHIVEAGDENRGWLGVALEGCTASEASGSTEAPHGATVINVVKDSPADKAGLTQNDVILAINGTDVSSTTDVGKLIGELGPGGVANLTVRRDGQTLEFAATLEAPRQGEIEWRFAPDVVFKEEFRTLPHVWRVAPEDGKFALKLAVPHDLPGSVHSLLRKFGATTSLSFKDGQRALRIVRNTDGKVVEISRDGDGPITVKRYTEGQDDATEAEYADEAALEAADADAYALFKQHQPTAVWIDEDDHGTFDFDFDFDPDHKLSDEIRRHIERQMSNVGMNMEEARRALEAALSQIPDVEIHKPGAPPAFGQESKATRRFKVQPDGQIELTVRKGDSEVVTLYKDEADLEARNPEAFARYREVIESDTSITN